MSDRRLHKRPSKARAVVLLSGGLDSATTLYWAIAQGHECHALAFVYGQRHHKEVVRAKSLAHAAGCPIETVKIGMPWKGSALLDDRIKVPTGRDLKARDIPATYVPARNIIFLSFAASFAEAIGAGVIFIGANAVDYSGYPDCRPDFMQAFERVLRKGLKTGVEHRAIKVATPLIRMSKAGIVRLGARLGVPFDLTWSCYQGGRKPCGSCDSCRLRAKGFEEAGMQDG